MRLPLTFLEYVVLDLLHIEALLVGEDASSAQVGQHVLAERAGITSARLRGVLESLEDRGYIRVERPERRAASNCANRYHLLPEPERIVR